MSIREDIRIRQGYEVGYVVSHRSLVISDLYL
jgi:hypothetical protein